MDGKKEKNHYSGRSKARNKINQLITGYQDLVSFETLYQAPNNTTINNTAKISDSTNIFYAQFI